ncbi:MAG: hypothetical protein ACR2I8_10235, partial [Steroidobacteraceae bacterium]
HMLTVLLLAACGGGSNEASAPDVDMVAAGEAAGEDSAAETAQDSAAEAGRDAVAPEAADLVSLGYDELESRARDEERKCWAQHEADASVNVLECYTKAKQPYAEACLAKDQSAQADCAEAADPGHCIQARHPEAFVSISVSGCTTI